MTDRTAPLASATALLLALLHLAAPTARAQTGPAEGKQGLVELSKFDARLKGHYAPKGFKVQIVAAEPAIVDPTAMAFDDKGNLYVAEWKYADSMFDTMDTLKLPEGGTTRIMRRRKGTTDVVKRLRDLDGDGVYESSEVVVEGAEMPSSIFPWKNSLYLTCSGRLERWSDDDGDGKFETRTILANGFCAFYHHWLSGMTLNADGWMYLTAGDNDNHVIGSDGSRVEVSRCGAIFRCRVDGSDMHLFAMGFRNPYRDVAFNRTFDPFHVDNDQEEGSKFQGVRFINPVEEGDYGWRLRPGAPCCQTDFDRGAVSGELPGKLPILAQTGRGAPAGLTIYNGVSLPEAYRDMPIYPDVFRKLVRAYKVQPQGGSYKYCGEITLMTADDDLFRPCQTVVGPDGALYVLDWRSNSGGAGRLWGDRKYGRLYKMTWEGYSDIPGLPLKPNNWDRVVNADVPGLIKMIAGPDFHEAQRALRELVTRGEPARGPLLALMTDPKVPESTRLLGLQGARQLWNPQVQAALVATLDDHSSATLRRLAAQALAWEPKTAEPGLLSTLLSHLHEPDPHALRDIALGIGRHGALQPQAAASGLLGWLLIHRDADVTTRDAFIRGLERLGDVGVDAVAQLVRKSTGPDQAVGVAIFSAFRTAPAARKLLGLVQTPGLAPADRVVLVRMFKDIPLNIPTPTEGLAAWVAAHPAENDAAVKVATLDVCRLAGNPAFDLVTALVSDPDESVRLAAYRLAAEARLQPALDRIRGHLVDAGRSPAERLAMVQSLRSAGPDSGSGQAIEAAYARFATDIPFRKAALRALAAVDRPRASGLATRLLKDVSGDLKAEAIQVLGETPQTATALGKAFLDKDLSRDDLPAVLAAMRKYGDADHRKMLAAIEDSASKGIASISVPDLKARVAKGADPWRGLSVYLRETGTRCYTCHKIENVGGVVGPALTGAYTSISLDKLIESMLNPSKEIKEGYESYKVELKDGRVLNGIKVAQDKQTLILRDATGQESRIPLATVEAQTKDSVSLMPLGLLNDMSPADLADLIAFLQSRPAQETLRHRQRIDRFMAFTPEADRRGRAMPPIGLLEPTGMPVLSGSRSAHQTGTPIETASSGQFNVRGQFTPKSDRVLLVTGLHSVAAQDVVLRIGLDSRATVAVPGGPGVAVVPKGRPASGDNLIHMTLKPGWTLLEIAIDRTPNAEGRGIVEIQSAAPVSVTQFGFNP